MSNYEIRKELSFRLKQYGYTEFEFNYLFPKGIDFILTLFPNILDD